MTQTASAANDNSRHNQYLRVFALGFSAFIFNTTEFVPVGLLTDIAKDFDVPLASAGWMLTIYAWIVASMSLPMMMLTSKMERKTLLLSVFTLFIVSHGFSVIAWNFEMLVASRIGIAFAHAVFWSITASIAIRVAPPGKKTLALSVLATGTSLAMVLGVPLGRIIGQWLGWRVTFGVIGVTALLIMFALFRLLPTLPSLFSGSMKKLPELLRKPTLLGLYLFIFLLFTAHYTAYSYIEPFVKVVGQVSENFTTFLLLLFGGAGILGSVIFGYWGERANTKLLVSNTAVVMLCMVLLLLSANSPWGVSTLLLLWGTALMIVCLAMQVKVLNIDTNASDMIMSMFSGIINLGIGAGALIGAKVIHFSSLEAIGYVGSGFALLALLLIVTLLKKFPSIR
ncbi:sugar transporter [Vibrio fluvialis]|jgi:DHA1 family L-arabinose/isopropyl-beta-D-thiogalactopyranoside export protein-like MFS transporter|uniref:sugar transporter n=1 Tax=Vibrio fluvialis TaxID=676 RepID=UPI00035769C0|nr:sugar transporter [Vibrio fluvialis]EKO3403057.1 sugar transporter [Vibrio fluvialis]EKO3406066.1 sugar transporter [Vibrio fluvialis]EKO3407088.1 sugar transporter [Vibrio fluvialis]EKO3440759.1 sugar transporter [Vibrio fluvialis]EKO3481028.1 sugar transporter [Vibrio fluvialis]